MGKGYIYFRPGLGKTACNLWTVMKMCLQGQKNSWDLMVGHTLQELDSVELQHSLESRFPDRKLRLASSETKPWSSTLANRYKPWKSTPVYSSPWFMTSRFVITRSYGLAEKGDLWLMKFQWLPPPQSRDCTLGTWQHGCIYSCWQPLTAR